MSHFALTDQQLDDYHEKGYVLLKSFFETEDVELLHRAAKEDKELDDHSFGKADGEGGTVRLSLWNHPGEGIYGAFARSERLVGAAEQILQDEPYHYHSKMIMKDALIGGAWAWHQDYGYWYGNGVLTPNLVSAFIAVDPSTRENGCLQIIKSSHKCGRIHHEPAGDQTGADLDRVAAILTRFELEYVEMDPGDTLLFHSNLLHRSDQNKSAKPRWSMVCCYNARHNESYKESQHPLYTPLNRVPDTAIRQMGLKRFANDPSNVSWLDSSKVAGED